MAKGLTEWRWAAAVVALAAAAPVWAQERQFDIPAQSATTGIAALGRQAGVQILAARHDTRGRHTNAVRGEMGVDRALAQLLAGTGLTARMTGARTYSVVPIEAAAPDSGRDASLALAQQANEEPAEVVVTGTNIPGADVTSPVRSYGHAQIEAAGNVTLEQFARNLPQNFNSTNRETAALGISGSDSNAYGTGFNLRGLGAGSTLTLINGRRVAPGGSDGAFVDVSIIPLVAVERVDVLTDGSSAVYGADAVAGVVNIVLRDHYDGAETSVYGNIPTRGGGREAGISQIVGKAWSTGNVMLAGDYYDARPIFTNQRDFVPPSTFPLPFALSPRFKRQSLIGNAEQHIGPVLTLFFQGSYNHQRFVEDQSLFSFSTNRISGTEKAYSGTGGANIALNARWSIELSGSRARTRRQSTNAYAALPFVNSGRTGTDLTEGQARATGALVDLPGGVVRTAFGYQARHESYRSHYSGNTFADQFSSSARDVDGLFGELSVPLVGDGNGRPGLRRLLLSGALRYDHYSDVGGATSPKAGALWGPLDGLDFRATWGRSFRPPLLSQLDPNGLSYDLEPFPTPDGKFINTLYTVGSNPSLKPERSTAISIGADVKPRAVKGLEVSTSYFSIDYRDRIAQPPVAGGAVFAFFDPAGLSRFLSYPADPALVAAAFATGKVQSSSGLTQSDVQAYFNDQLNNIARMKTSGLEFALTYSFQRPIGTITAGIDGNWIFTLKQRPSAGEAYVKLDNMEYQPADFRANATFGWSKGPASVTGILHYVGSYRNTLVTPDGRVHDWLTGDIAINYDFGSSGPHGLLSGMRATIVVQNVLDAAPPRLRVDPAANVADNGYDPTNASAIGRAVSLRLAKAW